MVGVSGVTARKGIGKGMALELAYDWESYTDEPFDKHLAGSGETHFFIEKVNERTGNSTLLEQWDYGGGGNPNLEGMLKDVPKEVKKVWDKYVSEIQTTNRRKAMEMIRRLRTRDRRPAEITESWKSLSCRMTKRILARELMMDSLVGEPEYDSYMEETGRTKVRIKLRDGTDSMRLKGGRCR